MVWFVGDSDAIMDAIEQLEGNSDRAIGIVAATMLEEHITEAIKRRWHDSPSTIRRMLQPDGPLGNFGPKIDLIFLMGLISKEGHQDLVLIKKVRNKFAHYLDADSFDTAIIKGWCFDIKHFEKFVLSGEEMSGPTPPKKIFGSSDMSNRLQTAKGRYIVAIQCYSFIFGAPWKDVYTPLVRPPTPFY